MADEHLARRARLSRMLVERELDAGVVTNLVNVRYLTGFTGSNGALRVRADATTTLVTDGRYRDQAGTQCPELDLVVSRDRYGALTRLLEDDARVGLETHDLSVDAYGEITQMLAGRGVVPVSLDRAVEDLRVRKDRGEVAALRGACEMSTAALAEIHAGPLLGRSEKDIARDLEWRMYAHGADAIGFATIVAGGPNSAVPHHQPTDRVLEPGDLLKIDFGARFEGYHADCTRTVVVGRARDWQREIHEATRQAQQAGLEAMVDGAAVAQPWVDARTVLDRAGWLEHFTTGIGHGVGLAIHEDPFVSDRHPGRLQSGTALTMEPGVYVPGRGGVRIEDTLVVTDGHPDVLTVATKDLLELG